MYALISRKALGRLMFRVDVGADTPDVVGSPSAVMDDRVSDAPPIRQSPSSIYSRTAVVTFSCLRVS